MRCEKELRVWTKVKEILVQENIINFNGIGTNKENQKIALKLRELLANNETDKLYKNRNF